jgi:hypothetical protein
MTLDDLGTPGTPRSRRPGMTLDDLKSAWRDRNLKVPDSPARRDAGGGGREEMPQYMKKNEPNTKLVLP